MGVPPHNKLQNLSTTSKPVSKVGPNNSGVLDTFANSTNRSGQLQQLSAKNPPSQMTTTKTVQSISTIDIKRRAREKQYEKIKEYAQKFNVDEAMIYALLSEYKGM